MHGTGLFFANDINFGATMKGKQLQTFRLLSMYFLRKDYQLEQTFQGRTKALTSHLFTSLFMFIHLPLIHFAPPPRLLIDFKNRK